MTDREDDAGRGVIRDVTLTQGGVLLRLPWATLCRPYRAENWLALRFFSIPCLQSKDAGYAYAHFGREGVVVIV